MKLLRTIGARPAPWWAGFAVVALLQAAVLQTVAVAAPDAGPKAIATLQRQAFERAAQDFRERRFAAAYGQFARLADAGHAPSASIALLMFREGRLLFRTDWDASLDQRVDWSARTVEAVQRELEVQP